MAIWCASNVYTDHNSKFRFSGSRLWPSLKVTQSPILAILQYCCGLAQSQLPNTTPICFQRKRNFELRSVYAYPSRMRIPEFREVG